MIGTGINRYLEENGRYSHMNLIVAVDEKWGIGKDGGLLAHLPEDMKYFRETTSGRTVVMGRRTRFCKNIDYRFQVFTIYYTFAKHSV